MGYCFPFPRCWRVAPSGALVGVGTILLGGQAFSCLWPTGRPTGEPTSGVQLPSTIIRWNKLCSLWSNRDIIIILIVPNTSLRFWVSTVERRIYTATIRNRLHIRIVVSILACVDRCRNDPFDSLIAFTHWVVKATALLDAILVTCWRPASSSQTYVGEGAGK